MDESLPQELHLPKLNLTTEQQAILESLGFQITQRLMQLNFADPTLDQRNIRFHASITGKLEAIHELLGYDARVAEKLEEQLREKAFTNTDIGGSQDGHN